MKQRRLRDNSISEKILEIRGFKKPCEQFVRRDIFLHRSHLLVYASIDSMLILI